jgi:hypothetical protein
MKVMEFYLSYSIIDDKNFTDFIAQDKITILIRHIVSPVDRKLLVFYDDITPGTQTKSRFENIEV